jgi:hypothetical protein
MEELLFAVVWMFPILYRFARHPIALSRPGTEVDHLASLGAKRPEAVGRRHIDGLVANRTTHRAHLNRKLPDSRPPCNSSVDANLQ